MAPLRILISGGGIAGPAVAFWLARLGHSCTVVERSSELRASGQQIDLREQGIADARRMGILDEVRRRAVDEAGTEFVDAAGRTRVFVAKGPAGAAQSFTAEYEIMRGDMCRLLFEATAHSVAYRFGVTVDDFDADGDGVRVTLSDGSVESFDLLVGADGQSSRIRKKMLGHASAEDSYRSLGAFAGYYRIGRRPGDRNNVATVCHVPGERFIIMRWHSDDSGQAYLFTMAHADALRSALKQDSRRQKEAFAAIFNDAGWQAPRLLAEKQAADDFYAQEVVQVRGSRWSKGRVVLLGDAGYAPSPFTGMGTSLALVGAYVLAGEIARHPGDLDAALRAYDQTLRPFVDEVQTLPPGFPRFLFAKTATGVRALQLTVWLADLVVRWSRALRLDKVLGALARVLPRRKQWTLPEYPELGDVKPMTS